MTWFNNLKIGKKLGMGFAVVDILIITLGGFALVQVSKVHNNTVEIANNWLPSVRTLGQLRYDAAAVRRWELSYFLNPDKAQAQGRIDRSLAAVLEDEKKY